MPRMRRILLPLLVGLAALIAAAAATLGTIWCAKPDRPARMVIFGLGLLAMAAVQCLFLRDGWAWLIFPEGMYLLLFLFARRWHKAV